MWPINNWFLLCGGFLMLLVAVLALAINPRRAVNRSVAGLIVVGGLWQIMTVIHFFHPFQNSYVYLCVGAAIGSTCPVFTILLLDSICFPFASPIERFRRNAPLIVLAAAAATIPFSNYWLGAPDSTGHRLFGPLRFVLNCWLAGVTLFLIFRTRRKFKYLPPAQAFEARLFYTMLVWQASTLVFLVILGGIGGTARFVQATNCAVGLVFAAMLMSPRVVTFTELRRALARNTLIFLVWLAWFVPLSFLAFQHLPPLAAALALGVLALGVSRIPIPAGMRFLRGNVDLERGEIRNKLRGAANTLWADSQLIDRFTEAVRQVTGEPTVEFVRTRDLAHLGGSQARSALVAIAEERRWITPSGLARSLSPRELKSVLTAFDSERLSAVAMTKMDAEYHVLFVGQQSTQRLLTYSTIQFVLELMDILDSGLERIRLADRLTHSQKLAMLGYLATEVRHDRRNRFEAIRAALENLVERREANLSSDHRLRLLNECDELILEDQIHLDLARKDVGLSAPLDVAEAVRDAVDTFLSHATGVEIETQIPDDFDVRVKADKGLLRGVLINLMRNAKEALAEIRAPRIVVSVHRSESTVFVDVVDNGPGIPVEIYDQLFVDFGTTKARGTGFGLSYCRASMRLMGGDIGYLSAKGQPRAHFRISLPVGAEKLERVPVPAAPTFLVIDPPKLPAVS